MRKSLGNKHISRILSNSAIPHLYCHFVLTETKKEELPFQMYKTIGFFTYNFAFKKYLYLHVLGTIMKILKVECLKVT